jgi:four helix bundle protein
MELKRFRTYQLSIEFYRRCEQAKMPFFLKNQLLRAASSICLNLAEGSTRPRGGKDRARYYLIALGSLRESQAALDLNPQLVSLHSVADRLGASVYRLCYPPA